MVEPQHATWLVTPNDVDLKDGRNAHQLYPEQEDLRRELRSYFTKLMTPERREALSSTQGEYGVGNVYRETVAQMGKDGWLTLNWPKEYGGQDRSRWTR